MRYVIYYFSKYLGLVQQRFKYFDLWLDVFVSWPLVYLQYIQIKKKTFFSLKILRDTFLFSQNKLTRWKLWSLVEFICLSHAEMLIRGKESFLHCFLFTCFYASRHIVMDCAQGNATPVSPYFHTVVKVRSLTITLISKEENFHLIFYTFYRNSSFKLLLYHHKYFKYFSLSKN